MAGTLTEQRDAPANPVKRRAALLSIASNTTLILLKVIAGLNEPSRGAVRFRGRDITKLSPDKRVHEGITLI